MNRREFIAAAAGLPALAQLSIASSERDARKEKARRLMHASGLSAIVMERGSSLFYFTGQSSGLWMLPSQGEPVLLPAGPDSYPKLAAAIRDRGMATAKIGIEERAAFALFDALRRDLPQANFASATPVTAGCRMIKSPAEIALLQRANDLTITAYKATFPRLREGMTNADVSKMIEQEYEKLGVKGDAMVIFGTYTANPHGSRDPQKLREGDIVLVDDGCIVEGYQSDITRTFVFGKPTARQRQVWEVERHAQDAAFAAAKIGAPCEAVDAAARRVIEKAGFGPGYKLPGLPHRTGHGIGLDGHEWTYLVKGNRTPIAPGMVFSNEPTIAIPGEFGIRLEDCMYITETGPRFFTPQSPSIEQPFAEQPFA